MKNHDIVHLVDKTKEPIVINFESLIDDGVCNVITIFEEILMKKLILHTFLFKL